VGGNLMGAAQRIKLEQEKKKMEEERKKLENERKEMEKRMEADKQKAVEEAKRQAMRQV
jgi:hypothetical protein